MQYFRSWRYRLVFCVFFLSIQGGVAQETDHLSMQLRFQDSLLHVEAEYRVATSSLADTVYFMLNPGFALESITGNGLQSYERVQRPGRPIPYWALHFERPLPGAGAINLRFRYTIDLVGQNHLSSDWIELNADKLWFPNRNDLDNLFTYEVRIEGFPADYTLIGYPGVQIVEAGERTEMRNESPAYEVLLLAGKDLRVWDGGDHIRFHAGRQISDAILESMHLKVRNTVDFLNRTQGGADPIDSLTVLLRNTSREELGFQFNRGTLIVTGPEFDDYGNLSHEIAHYWWSGADFMNEPWMNESFANYAMYSVLRKFDPEDFERLRERNRERSAQAIPVSEASLFAPDSYTSFYHKGAIHLLELEETIGQDRMQALLSACIGKDIHETAAFLQELERQTNPETRRNFEAMLNK